MKNKPITMQEIATGLGVSIATVSKVLHNHSDIGETTRRRVLQRVEELDFQANPAARSLVTRRSNLIGLIVPRLTDPFFAEVSMGLFSIFRARDYSLVVAYTEEDPNLERRAIAQMRARRVDSLLITSVQTDLAAFGALEMMEIPFVCLQRRPFGVTANFAGWDDVGSGIAATTHLMEIGCQRIAYIGGSNSKIAGDRHAGYLQALARQGSIPPDEYVVDGDCGNSSWQAFGFKAMLRLLQLDPRPDSIFCWNDPVALGAIRAIEGAGLRIPKDIAIVGCGNSHSDSWSSVPLSSIDQNSQRLGASAAMLALRLMDQPAMVPQSLIVPAQLIVRASSQR